MSRPNSLSCVDEKKQNVVSVTLGSSETYATVILFNVGLTEVKMEDTAQRRVLSNTAVNLWVI
jgi:hypothetical protein